MENIFKSTGYPPKITKLSTKCGKVNALFSNKNGYFTLTRNISFNIMRAVSLEKTGEIPYINN